MGLKDPGLKDPGVKDPVLKDPGPHGGPHGIEDGPLKGPGLLNVYKKEPDYDDQSDSSIQLFIVLLKVAAGAKALSKRLCLQFLHLL